MLTIEINIATQQLIVWQQQQAIAQFTISSALKGVGEIQGSEQTPRGKHIIRAKIGQHQPLNSVFKARRPTGEIYNAELAEKYPNRDWILTRIMWLSGCELGKNRSGQCDTMRRYIYIHGTPDSEPMGVPLSHGCIRMRNQDIIQLFDLVTVYTPVIIHE